MLAASGRATASTTAGSLPPDERIAAPETRHEIIDGERVYVPPADEPHATEHLMLGYLLAAHVAPGYRGALDMLTRTSETSDYAPDASVFAGERDPETGGRQLEELAFEVVSTQSLSRAGAKAEKLATRGVRRVFAIHVVRQRAFEWSRELGTWELLDPAASVEDSALAAPLPVAALLESAKVDDAVQRALIAKHNPVLETELARARAEGKAEGKAEALLQLIAARFGELPERDWRRVRSGSEAELDRWFDRVLTARDIDDLLER
jgi:Uma2 family endonuclease